MSAVIRGVAECPHGRSTEPSTMALHETLVDAALADAGLERGQVDALLTVSPRSDPYLVHAEALAERLGIEPGPCHSVEAGGTAPIAMAAAAAGMIDAGIAEVAVVVAADLPLLAGSAGYLSTLTQVGPIHPEFEASYGVTPRSLYGLMARAYLHHHRLGEDALGEVALHDRAMAARHPHARFREPLDMAGYLASPLVCDPLRRPDCGPVTDGGGAVVLVRGDLPAAGHADVALAGVGQAMRHAHLSQAPSLVESAAGVAGGRALTTAGATIEDVDVALVYDCFSIAMLMNAEALGLAATGTAAKEFAAGAFGPGGRVVVNPHGGLLSHGYPARAAGMANLVEAIVQLRGEAGERQVPGCATALVHGMSGAQSGHAVAILREAA
ncbi:thiolase family protein [Nocardioides sp.]|uniref:thiolase family protein n=1 Tax=Nocardioides sp. TaxID=35761 RepID=UPI002B80A6F0|nr:thiolase family protein [Nocardioides sp.]HVX55656.1 thiolase family protein [Nocardioides sp.]